MNKITLALLLSLLAIPVFAAEEIKQWFRFKENGFSIAPLDVVSDAKISQVVAMFLPASDGFTPNVSVSVQRFTGSQKEFADLSKEQFKVGGYTMIKENSGDGFMTFEYLAESRGVKVHQYTKAEMSVGKVYLATATAKQTQWEAVGAQLKKCVDSLKRG